MNGQLINTQGIYSARALFLSQQCWTVPFIIVSVFLLFELSAPQMSFQFLQPFRPLLVLTILLSGILILTFLSGELDIKEPRIKLVLLFWILMGLHIPFAFNNPAAYGLTRAMFPYVVLFLGIVSFTKSVKQMAALIHLWLFLHTYQAIYAMTHGGRGIGGYFKDENDLAVSLCMAVPVAYFLFLGSRQSKRILYGCCLVILVLGVVFTFSRGGFLGLLGITAYCLWRSRNRFTGLSLIVLVVIIMVAFAPAGYWEEMETIKMGEQERTIENRVYLWKAAWRMFLDNPLWGVGPGSFSYAVPIYEPPGGLHGKYHGQRAVHSSHFTLLSELAIPGLIIFTLLIYRLFGSIVDMSRHNSGSGKTSVKLLAKEKESQVRSEFLRYAAMGLGGGLVGFLVAGTFVSMLYYPQFWVLIGIMVVTHQIRNQDMNILQNAEGV